MADMVHPAGLLAALAGLFAALALGAAGWFLVSRRRLRPARALIAARDRLDRGDWSAALQLAQRLRPLESAPPEPWHEEQVRLEGECLYASSEQALRAGRFTEALAQYRSAASLIGLSEAEATRRVAESMLAEVRRLLLVQPENPSIGELLQLIRSQPSPCPEACFWQGLSALRTGDTTAALASLKEAHERAHGQQADTALYYGAALLKTGQPRESLRVLAEANKLAPDCPLVAWQLGTALLTSGSDALLAQRALQKATATDGLPRYLGRPGQLWIETLPNGSWVRSIAAQALRRRSVYHCPLGFDRLGDVLMEARLSLAEAHELCGRSADAIILFTDLLKSRDTVAIRRGLGLALATSERFDEAIPHLRIAHENERPSTPRTTGTLALCLARARGDRVANSRRALALVASMSVRGDAHWARLAASVFAAAQAAGIPISEAEIRELSEVLTSTDATDPVAANVYDLLAERAPAALRPETAWLYARAAQLHNARGQHDRELLDRAFTQRDDIRRYFAEREWDFDAAERLYLRRWAERSPGTFPAAPGPDYAVRAEAMLLADSKRAEAQNRPDNARDSAELALKLAPASAAAHDRLAELHYRLEDFPRSVEQLRSWRHLQPADPRPQARLAVMLYGQGRPDDTLKKLHRVLDRVRGVARLPLLFLGARCAVAAGRPHEAVAFLDECLSLDASNAPALTCLAAVLSSIGDQARLAQLAQRFAQTTAEDPWCHYFAALALCAAGQSDAAEAAARRAIGDPATAAAGHHLLGVIQLHRPNPPAAAKEFVRASDADDVPTREHALAVRGEIAWTGGDYAEAIRCWVAIPSARRAAWRLDTVVPGTAFIAGITALRDHQPDDAVRSLRMAKELGFDDPRLEPLLVGATLAATRTATNPARALRRLEKSLHSCHAPVSALVYLARAYRRQNRLADARRIVEQLPNDDAGAALERGLLCLAERQLVPAERAFAHSVQLDPNSGAGPVNLLLCRLSLGRYAAAIDILPRAAYLAPTSEWRRLLGQLKQVCENPPVPDDRWTDTDDQAMVDLFRGLARLDVVELLAERLAVVRPLSPVIQALRDELLPLRAKDRIDRGDASEAIALLDAEVDHGSPLVHHLFGLATCLRQDFSRAARHFAAALPADGDDPRIQQNLALTRGWQGDQARSATHWRRFLEHQANLPAEPGAGDYHARIAELVRERMRADKLAHGRLTGTRS